MIQPNRLDRAIEYFSPTWGHRRAVRRALIELAQYAAGSTSRIRSNWVTGTGSDTADPTATELETIRARARDANRNHAVSQGAMDTLKLNIVGQGLRPQSMIDYERLGISEEAAEDLKKQAEGAFELFSQTADSQNIMTFDEIQLLALAKIIEDGEIIALPIMADETWRKISRAVELHESERLANPLDRGKSKDLVNGIKFGDRGQPLAYHISYIDKGESSTKAWKDAKFKEIAARDDQGRPMVLHVFPVKRPGQTRGIPVFAPVLSIFKDLADYMEAEIVAARVAACLAVFVTKLDPYNSAKLMGGDDTETNTSARIQAIEPGLVSYLNIGEDIKVVDPRRPGENYDAFVMNLLKTIGMALNLPYELLAKDFSKTNYSSARAALLEGRRMFLTWRTWFANRFCKPIWDLVLEEAFLREMFDAPKFYENKHEYCKVRWIGGAWGWVDPAKEIDASKKAIDYNLSTLAEEAAGQGRDWEEILKQRNRENKKEKDLGVESKGVTGPSNIPNDNDNKDEED